jgi:uracil-DNA glycosylase family 4
MPRKLKDISTIKVINNYKPKCNDRKFPEDTTDAIVKCKISSYQPKVECVRCEIAFDSVPFDSKDDKSIVDKDYTLTFEQEAHKYGNNTGMMVQGQNIKDCHVLFIGNAPCKSETEHGIPFISKSGQLLRKILLKSMNNKEFVMDIKDVGFTNVVHCKTLNDGDPKPDIIKQCRHRLDEDLETAKPFLIVTVGKMPSALLINDPDSYRLNYQGKKIHKRLRTISDHHGDHMFPAYYKDVRVIPIWDPRDYYNAKKNNEAEAMSIRKRIEWDIDFIQTVYREIMKADKPRMQVDQELDW